MGEFLVVTALAAAALVVGALVVVPLVAVAAMSLAGAGAAALFGLFLPLAPVALLAVFLWGVFRIARPASTDTGWLFL